MDNCQALGYSNEMAVTFILKLIKIYSIREFTHYKFMAQFIFCTFLYKKNK